MTELYFIKPYLTLQFPPKRLHRHAVVSPQQEIPFVAQDMPKGMQIEPRLNRNQVIIQNSVQSKVQFGYLKYVLVHHSRSSGSLYIYRIFASPIIHLNLG
jgi:hypothetical protein